MSEPLWTFDALIQAMRGRPFGPAPRDVTGISIDSRTVQPGDAFFAIKGDKLDGHDFVSRALAHGAATAVVAEERLAGLGRMTQSLVVVADVLKGLGDLGRAARARTEARIAAVTGSVGKTTTKEMLRHVLGRQGRTHGSSASFNNHWGVPLTLARMPEDSEFGVFEVGMNHAGEITPLIRMIRPHVGVITNVEPVHLAYFPDGVEGIARAKAEIFAGIEPGGTAVLNRDNRHFDLLAELARAAGVARVVGFGVHEEAEARLEDVVLAGDGSLVSARVFGEDVTFSLGAPGRHIVQNSLAVLAAAVLLGCPLDASAEALGDIRAPKGRGERLSLDLGQGTFTLLDESYNANPTSMRAALALLGQSAPTGRGMRIAVLGDMLELGDNELALHAGLAADVGEAGVGRVHCVGPRMAALYQALPAERRGAYAETAAELLPALVADLAPGDVVMVKGSNGIRLGPLVEALKEQAQAAAAGGAARG